MRGVAIHNCGQLVTSYSRPIQNVTQLSAHVWLKGDVLRWLSKYSCDNLLKQMTRYCLLMPPPRRSSFVGRPMLTQRNNLSAETRHGRINAWLWLGRRADNITYLRAWLSSTISRSRIVIMLFNYTTYCLLIKQAINMSELVLLTTESTWD